MSFKLPCTKRIKSQRWDIVQNNLGTHVEGDHHWYAKGKATRRLRQWHHAVNDGVQDPASGVNSEQQGCPRGHRPSRQVQGSQDPKRRNVLQVIKMSASHPLYRLIIELHFSFQCLCILRVSEHSTRYTSYCRQS